jgi:hypothetical protein
MAVEEKDTGEGYYMTEACRKGAAAVLTFALGPEGSCRDPVSDALSLPGRKRAVVLDLHAPDHAVPLDALGHLVLLLVLRVLYVRVEGGFPTLLPELRR